MRSSLLLILFIFEISNSDKSLRQILFGTKGDISADGSKLDVSFSNNYNDYSINVNGDKWLSSADIYLRNNNGNASLKLNGTSTTTGKDNIGSYSNFILEYIDQNDESAVFNAIFRTYSSIPDIIIFEQSFPNSIKNTATTDCNDVISAFPSFKMADAANNTKLG